MTQEIQKDENGCDLTGITPPQERQSLPVTHPMRIFDQLNGRKYGTDICITCKQPQPIEKRAEWTEAGQREWYISQECEPCWDKMVAAFEAAEEIENERSQPPH